MGNIAGIAAYIPHSESEALALIENLAICGNCRNCKIKNLFDAECHYWEFETVREVSLDMACEGFEAKEKKVQYWISKMVAIICDVNPEINDFTRQLNYHQNNGTDYEFLGITS